jgi:phosphatidylglycerophosphate synthase
VLDIFDGMAARYFNQKSLLGYYLDMVIDRISSCVALHFAAVAVLSGLTIVPASLNTPVVYVLYSCLVMVEIIAHGVVCYFAEVLGIHQKHLGFDYLLVRLYLDSKALLFYGCASYEVGWIGSKWKEFMIEYCWLGFGSSFDSQCF